MCSHTEQQVFGNLSQNQNLSLINPIFGVFQINKIWIPG
jgi:hypothetical protein